MSDGTTQTANTQASGDAQQGAVASASPAGDSSSAGAVLLDSAPASQQATEGQTTDQGEKPAEASTEGDKGTEGDKPQGAPEKYEFKAPEGKSFDEGVISAYSEVAKELNLPQDAAQKILDVIAPKVAERFEARQLEAVQQAAQQWQSETTADKEIGGDKLQENLAVAKKALDAFGTPELRKLLGAFDAKNNPTGTGLGNHPEIIRAFLKAGKAISEDKFVPGGKEPPKAAKSQASALYPNQP